MGLVMFDYDGVIVDSFEQVCSDFLKACSAYGFAIDEEGFNCLHDDNCYRAMKEQYGLSEKVIDAILQEYEEITKKKQDLRVFEGMHEAIKKIAEKHTVVVITSNISANVREVLYNNGITEFEDIVGAEKEKSKVKKIRRAMKSYPSDISYYIGDTAGDMIEAREAGAKTIAVSWGYQSAERLKKADPDYLVNSPEELTALLCSVSAPTE